MNNILHLKAPGDWINDPNGFIYYKGKYHLFYQYFPGCSRWGLMHWGHAISDDLISWKHLGIALYPSKPFDKNGCFSGSAIELNDGSMAIYYTGVKYLAEDPYNTNLCPEGCSSQSQAMLISEDGFSFDNDKKLQIIKAIEDLSIGDPAEFRDPKVFFENNKYFMVTGSTHEKSEGVLLVHESTDGFNWNYKSRYSSEKLGKILECPDLFKLGNKWILMCSPMFIADGEVRSHQSCVGFAEFDAESGQFELEKELRYLDYGMDLYAPQSTTDEKGRRVYIGWMRMEEAKEGETNLASNGRIWNGMMSLPRLIEIEDGNIVTPVHPNVSDYFDSGNKKIEKIEVSTNIPEEAKILREAKISEKPISEADKSILVKKIDLTINEGEIIEIDGFKISLEGGKIITDRSKRLPEDLPNYINRISRTPFIGEECNLEIFVEQNIIEVFVNKGKFVISNIVY